MGTLPGTGGSHRRAGPVGELAAGMTGHAVVIAGGGPTGMMLAAELTLGGSTSSAYWPPGSSRPATVPARSCGG